MAKIPIPKKHPQNTHKTGAGGHRKGTGNENLESKTIVLDSKTLFSRKCNSPLQDDIEE
jgi:hypothetical protein